MVAASANATSSACRSIAHSSGSVSPIASTAFAYSSRQRDVRDRRVVRGERHRHAHPVEPRQRVRRDARHDAGLPVRGRAQVEGHAAGRQLGTERGVVDRARAVGDPLRVHRERRRTCAAPPHSPAWSGDPQAAGSGRLEGRRVDRRVRVGRLRPGEVPAGQALVAEADRGLGEGQVRGRVVRAQRRADEPDRRCRCAPRRPRLRRRPPRSRPRATGRRADVQQRTPADLDVADVVGGLGLDQLAR